MEKVAAALMVLVFALTLFAGLSQSAEPSEVWLVGDHHMHTLSSDGSHTMEYDVEHAEGLDFIVITNHGSTENLGKIEKEYEELLRLREENPELLMFYGLSGTFHQASMRHSSSSPANRSWRR